MLWYRLGPRFSIRVAWASIFHETEGYIYFKDSCSTSLLTNDFTFYTHFSARLPTPIPYNQSQWRRPSTTACPRTTSSVRRKTLSAQSRASLKSLVPPVASLLLARIPRSLTPAAVPVPNLTSRFKTLLSKAKFYQTQARSTFVNHLRSITMHHSQLWRALYE